MNYNIKLKELMNDFDRSTDRLNEVLKIGGKIDEKEVDYYNYIHTCIQEAVAKIKIEESKNEN